MDCPYRREDVAGHICTRAVPPSDPPLCLAPGACDDCVVPTALAHGTCVWLSPRVFLKPLRPRFGISFPQKARHAMIDKVEWYCKVADRPVAPGEGGCDDDCPHRVDVPPPPAGPATLNITMNGEGQIDGAFWSPTRTTDTRRDMQRLREELGVTGTAAFMATCPKDGTPCKLAGRLTEFSSANPPEANAFLMMHFPDGETATEEVIKHFRDLRNGIRRVLSECSMQVLVADDKRFTQDLACNVCACAQCSAQGVAVLAHPVYDKDDEITRFRDFSAINYNVAFELGMMWGLGRTCIVLKHRDIEKPHTDVIGQIYVPYSTPREACEGLRNEIRLRQ